MEELLRAYVEIQGMKTPTGPPLYREISGSINSLWIVEKNQLITGPEYHRMGDLEGLRYLEGQIVDKIYEEYSNLERFNQIDYMEKATFEMELDGYQVPVGVHRITFETLRSETNGILLLSVVNTLNRNHTYFNSYPQLIQV